MYGLRLKQLVLLTGAVYFSLVVVTNVVDLTSLIGRFHWTFLNSGNAGYTVSVTKVYNFPAWFATAVVLVAALAEGIGAYLFSSALFRFRGAGTGAREAWLALSWNIAVWLTFIIGSEFFVAYQSEGPFRELLAIGLLMALVIAVVPDSPAAAPVPD